jgi:carboxyl-terminal processing protease
MRVIRNEVRQLWITASSELDGVVLDLRWNGWGYLPISVEVAWLFLPKNEIVTTARYSIFEDEVFKSPWYKILPDVPVTVLIDGMSASASEIVALALQERGNAHVIGVQSFGKWSIQSVQPGSDWSSLKLTVWRRYSPSNATIDEVGITPDQEVVFDIEAYLDDESDNQLEEAIEFLLWNNQ